jgi:hypothetical protein
MAGTRQDKVFIPLGASNHAARKRSWHDYYATDPAATEMLLDMESFAPLVWEPACGEGHISKVLERRGYRTVSTDLVYRGYGCPEPVDFMRFAADDFDGDIVTNPPYSISLEFVAKALELLRPGRKAAMFLRLLFLEGQARGKFYRLAPPKTVYVSRSRLLCARNGDFQDSASKAVAFAWFVWEKGFMGDPAIKWFN